MLKMSEANKIDVLESAFIISMAFEGHIEPNTITFHF